jgi:autotransporter-associated beta strand protein
MKNKKTKYLPSPRALGLPLAIACIGIVQTPVVKASSQTWDGAVSGVWDTSALNWAGAAFVSGNDALFTGTPTRNVTTATGLTIGAITLDNTFTGSVTLTGDNTVSGATTISGGTLTVTKPGTATGTVTAADLGTSAITVNNGGTLYIDDEGNGTTGAERILAFGNTISGAGTLQARASSLHTNGWSSVNFTGNLSGFTGTLDILAGTTANRGKVKFTTASQATLLSSSATVNVQNGAQLYLTQALTYGFGIHLNGGTGGEGNGSLRLDNASLNVTGAITLDASSTISGAGKISGSIGETGGAKVLTKVGNNTTVLTGANTYSGGTTISAGTVQVGSSSALGTGAVTLSGGKITFDASSTALTVNNDISGNTGGSLTLTPTNKITLGGTNNLTLNANFGGLIVNAGAGGVDITGSTTINGAAGNTQSGYMNVAGNVTVAIKSGGSLTINPTTNTAPGGIVGQNAAGTSTVSVESGGSLTFGGNQGLAFGNNRTDAIGVLDVSGTATIDAGSTTATDTRSFVSLGRDTGTGTVNLNTGGTLATGRNFIRDGSGGADTQGAANFNFQGGTLKALANQTDWLNSSTINTNQLALSSVTTTSANSTIDSNGFSVAVNNNISGSGGFKIISSSGSGTVTLGGANTFTGATVVNSGTLNTVALGTNLGAGNVTVSGGALTLNSTSIGNLTGIANFTMATGSTSFDIASLASFDSIAGSGSFAINGGTIILSGTLVGDGTDSYAIFSGFTGNTVGSFAFNTDGLSNLNGRTATLSNTGVLSFTAVPEPHQFAIAVVALLGVMVFVRRRNQRA